MDKNIKIRKKVKNILRKLILKFLPLFILKRLSPCSILVSKISSFDNLSTKEKLQIHFHLLFCWPCWVYEQQLRIINNKIKDYFLLKTKKEETFNKIESDLDLLKKYIVNKYSK